MIKHIPLNVAEITLKFIQRCLPVLKLYPKGKYGMANSVDPDLGLHYLPRPFCPKT